MSELAAFITARLDEDEAVARETVDNANPETVAAMFYGDLNENWIYHAQVRVLALVEAHRRIAEIHTGGHECPGMGPVYWDDDADWTEACPTLRALASVYADHPDYRSEWRP